MTMDSFRALVWTQSLTTTSKWMGQKIKKWLICDKYCEILEKHLFANVFFQIRTKISSRTRFVSATAFGIPNESNCNALVKKSGTCATLDWVIYQKCSSTNLVHLPTNSIFMCQMDGMLLLVYTPTWHLETISKVAFLFLSPSVFTRFLCQNQIKLNEIQEISREKK